MPAGVLSREYLIKDGKGDANSNPITVRSSTSQTIDGAATTVINTAYGFARLVFNGSQWNVEK